MGRKWGEMMYLCSRKISNKGLIRAKEGRWPEQERDSTEVNGFLSCLQHHTGLFLKVLRSEADSGGSRLPRQNPLKTRVASGGAGVWGPAWNTRVRGRPKHCPREPRDCLYFSSLEDLFQQVVNRNNVIRNYCLNNMLKGKLHISTHPSALLGYVWKITAK